MRTIVESLHRLYQANPAKYEQHVLNMYNDGKITEAEYIYITGKAPNQE